MPDCAKKKPNAMQEKTLLPGDTFTVPCDGCKNCCRNQRSFQFNLTGFDIYRMTRTIEMRPIEFIRKYCVMCYGDKSNLPVVYLKTRGDGSCCLFQKGECKAKENKPTACAIYPLGRYYSMVDDRLQYYKIDTCDSDENGEKWELEDWLDFNKIHEFDDISMAWYHVIKDLLQETGRLNHDRLADYKPLYTKINSTLYYNYYFQKPYREQLKSGIDALKYYIGYRRIVL